MKKFHRFFRSKSSEAGNSVLDWIRSVYFSLLGSSVLNFVLKFYSYGDGWSIYTSYTLGISFFLAGLYYSVIITKRYKEYEKSWPDEVTETKNVSFQSYCNLKEKDKSWQHTLFYFLWFPALLFIGVAGYRIESENKSKSLLGPEILKEIKKNNTTELKLVTELKNIEKKVDSIQKTKIIKQKTQ